MKALELTKRFLLSRLTVKLLTVVLFFFLIYPPFKPVLDGVVKIVLLWGGLQLLVDLLTKRTCLRARHAVWLILLLLMGSVTILINHQSGFKENASMLCYTAVGMLVLYPNDETRSREDLLREMRIIGWVYIGLCAVGSLISLLMLLMNYTASYEYGGVTYYIGLYHSRLFGVFSNPNFPTAAIASALCALQLFLCRDVTENRKTLPFQYVCLGFCAFFNLLFLMLSQSRGSSLAFLAFLFVFLFFLFRKTLLSRISSLVASCGLSFLASAVLLTAVAFAAPAIIRISDQLVTGFQSRYISESSEPSGQSTVSLPNDDPSVSDKDTPAGPPSVVIRPDNDNVDITSGRINLWRVAIKQFKESPIWGLGHSGSLERVSQDDNPVMHYHNLFFHSLAAGGIMGTAALLIVLFALIISMGKFIWRNRRTVGFQNGYIYAGIALFVFYMVNNMVEVYLIYNVSLPHFIFWIYMGYILSLATQGERRTLPDRLMGRLADRVPVFGRKKGEGR